jgi:hypothetical protein
MMPGYIEPNADLNSLVEDWWSWTANVGCEIDSLVGLKGKIALI